jgi:hypothetical protein
MSPHRIDLDQAAWDDRDPDGHGNAVPLVDFDYPVEETETCETACRLPTLDEALNTILDGSPSPEVAYSRLLAMAYVLRAYRAPETLAELGRKCGFSREYSRRLVDITRRHLIAAQRRGESSS